MRVGATIGHRPDSRGRTAAAASDVTGFFVTDWSGAASGVGVVAADGSGGALVSATGCSGMNSGVAPPDVRRIADTTPTTTSSAAATSETARMRTDHLAPYTAPRPAGRVRDMSRHCCRADATAQAVEQVRGPPHLRDATVIDRRTFVAMQTSTVSFPGRGSHRCEARGSDASGSGSVSSKASGRPFVAPSRAVFVTVVSPPPPGGAGEEFVLPTRLPSEPSPEPIDAEVIVALEDLCEVVRVVRRTAHDHLPPAREQGRRQTLKPAPGLHGSSRDRCLSPNDRIRPLEPEGERCCVDGPHEHEVSMRWHQGAASASASRFSRLSQGGVHATRVATRDARSSPSSRSRVALHPARDPRGDRAHPGRRAAVVALEVRRRTASGRGGRPAAALRHRVPPMPSRHGEEPLDAVFAIGEHRFVWARV